MSEKKVMDLVKVIMIYLCYFTYSQIITFIFRCLKVNNDISSIIADLVFLVIIIFAYKNRIKDAFLDIKKKKISQVIKKIFIWFIIIFLFNAIMGAITEAILPEIASVKDSNTEAIYKLSLYRVIFKTMIFSIFAEELLFRETLSKIIKNDFIFIIITSLVYASVSILYTYNLSNYPVFDFITYFLPALIFSTAYVKNNRNIIIIMIIKLILQMISLSYLLISS